MKKRRCSVLLSALVAISGSCLRAQDLALYPYPDESGEPIATIASDDAGLEERGPVVDASGAAEGWQWAELDGEFTGYVQDAKIGKDLFPVAGAMIHARPDMDSPVLTTITEEDLRSNAIEVLDHGPWWTVAFSKSIPVYYREPVVRGEADETPAAEPPPVVVEAAPLPEADAPQQDAPQQERVEAREAPPPAVLSDEDDLLAPPPGNQSVAGSLGSTFRGTLRRAEARFFVLRPPYPYELIDRNGQRVAYIDFENAVLPQPASSYLETPVSVYGPWETVGDSRTIVVRARNLHVLPPQ